MSSAAIPTQPNSLEAEATVLGALLLDPEAIYRVRSLLQPEDFYEPIHGRIYSVCVDLCDRQTPIDFTIVGNALKDDAKIQSIGGSAFLADLAANVPTASHVKQYALIVREKAQERKLIRVGQEIAGLGYQDDDSADEHVLQAQELVLQLGAEQPQQTSATAQELIQQEYKAMMDIKDGGEGDIPKRCYTGFSGLDYLFEGFRPQDLTIIVGRPGMGKTALMLTMAQNAVEMFGKKVLFMSREMSNKQNIRRIISSYLGVSMTAMDRAELTEEHFLECGKLIDRFNETQLTFDDDPDASITSIRAKAIRHKLEHGLDVLFIDYLQLLEPPTGSNHRYSNRVEQMSKISRDCKRLARELDVPLIMGCQMNREVDRRPDKRPQLSDIRESGSIEQDADNVIMMHRDSYYDLDPDSDASDVTELYIRKHRQGELGVVELQFEKNTTKFLQVDRRRGEEALAAV